VRPVPVVPADVQRQLALESRPAVRNKQPSRALVLQGADHSLDDRDTAVLADGSESLADASSSAPPSKPLVAELVALVGDQVAGAGPSLADGSAEERPDRDGSRLLVGDSNAHDSPRVVIDDDRDPPTERPALRQGPGEPRRPEAERSRDGTEIAVPDVIWIPGGHGTREGARHRCGRGPRSVGQHPLDGGRSKVQTRPAENLSNLDLSHRRTQHLEPPHDVGDEIGEPVHGITSLDERPGPSSSNRPIQEATVAVVTSIRLAVCAIDQALAVRSSKMASRSVGG